MPDKKRVITQGALMGLPHYSDTAHVRRRSFDAVVWRDEACFTSTQTEPVRGSRACKGEGCVFSVQRSAFSETKEEHEHASLMSSPALPRRIINMLRG